MGATSDGDRPWESYQTVYTNAKAGMDGVDKEKVQRVIYEMSKGSKYFENEQRKEAIVKQRIERMRAQCAKLTAKDIAQFQMIADKRILELESSRDLSKIWVHSDMDAFYAAVETLENPSLKGKPLAVGGKSMICTANYEVCTEIWCSCCYAGFIALKLCPNLVFVPTNFDKYMNYSEKTRKVFRGYDPNFIATSLDEAYLNITTICKDRCVSSQEVAEELRNAIYEETGLTCSVGVAPNRLLAKVCSDINKPNGQFILPNERKAILTFISSLPIRKIGGIGKVTEHILRDVLGINTCEEMLKKSAYLCGLFSPCSIDFFLSVGLGVGNTDTQFRLRKSISSERTFSSTEDQSLIFKKMEEIAETLSNDMQKESLFGRTLTLKLKTTSFEVKTRATSLQKYIQSKEDIFSHATKLLKAELPLSVRLIGLRMSHFCVGTPHSADPMQKTLSADNRALLSRTQEEVVLWINDYMCSLCGCELPPSFVEERQEHSDYHLAEMLQKESVDNFGKPTQGSNPVQKSPCVGRSARKRRNKSAHNDGKHIPSIVFSNEVRKSDARNMYHMSGFFSMPDWM
ncbi:unnamed protein product [Spirodela intermedia]|uniref:DNA polymerase kappa n=1 Tax=Spirodela intermedia TaxID=51605 RepID=A0A7I8IJJ4_SPIIN|nr:unnamed protein product [Spirodela intermedia]CAA6657529.1 unnamed protein product [Spirodela intermedia]